MNFLQNRILFIGVLVLSMITINFLKAQPALSGWQDFIHNIQQLSPAERPTFAEKFLKQHENAIPIVEERAQDVKECHTVFLYYGPAKHVKLAGDFTGWAPTAELGKIYGTQLWYYERSFAKASRVEYKIVVDDSWMLDPLNPKAAAGGYGSNSDVWMSQYKPPAWLDQAAPDEKGTVTTTEFPSQYLQTTRVLHVYLPYGYTSQNKYPLLVVHDGNDYIKFALMPRLLDLMIAQKQIRPIIVAFTDPVKRFEEYACSPAYVQFTQEELVPYLEKTYSISPQRQDRAFAGASMGGLISFWLLYKMQETFGAAICQSGAFFYKPSSEENRESKIIQLLTQVDYKSLQQSKIWLDCGNIGALEQVLLQGNQELYAKCVEFAIPHHYKEVTEAHNWGSWRKRLEPALAYLFAPLK